jgi:hypothetical protein
MSAATGDKLVLDEKAALVAPDIPQPATAPQERVQRRSRFKRSFLVFVCLVAAFHIARHWTHGPHQHEDGNQHGHGGHMQLHKPKGPLTADEAKKLFLCAPLLALCGPCADKMAQDHPRRAQRARCLSAVRNAPAPGW